MGLETKTVLIPLVLSPSELTDIHLNVLRALKNECIRKCIESVGFVTKIVKILDVHNDSILPKNGASKFFVKCQVETMNPKVNEILEGPVETIIPDKGIYITVDDAITIFCKWIPNIGMESLVEHDKVKCKILQSQIGDDRIICIGDYIATPETNN